MVSWKGDISRSGGIATNIGIHFFDVLSWIFGPVENNIVHVCEQRKAAGFLELKRGRVRWFLSLDCGDLPFTPKIGESMTHRSIKIDGEEIDFSSGFADLHTQSYRQILAGKGFGLPDILTSVEIVSDIRKAKPAGLKGNCHPMLKNSQI